MRYFLAGVPAVLLQVAHPLVAAGVADHSQFAIDALKRLIGTMQAVQVIAFGDKLQAADMQSRIRAVHRQVEGTLSVSAGNYQAGQRYSAMNPQLCMWVFATLVECALDSYSLLVRTLSSADRSAYYFGLKPFAEAFGVTEAAWPGSYEQFVHYYHNMLATLVVSEDAKAIARSIFEAKLWGLPVSPAGQIVATGLMWGSSYRHILAGYGLGPSWWQRLAWSTLRPAIYAWFKLAPSRLVHWQPYREAQRRVAG